MRTVCFRPIRFSFQQSLSCLPSYSHHERCQTSTPQCPTSLEAAKTSPSEGHRVTGSVSHTEYGGSPHQLHTVYINWYQQCLAWAFQAQSYRHLAEATKLHGQVALQMRVRVWMKFCGWLITSSSLLPRSTAFQPADHAAGMSPHRPQDAR